MNVPILLLLYKKPKTTIQVINALKKVKPKFIYISINVPPLNKNDQDYNNYKKVLKLVEEINWKCDLKIKKRKKHLSAYNSMKNSVDWFFENEKEGIVLEDDTIPNKSFFTFCSQLLKKYRYNKKIAMICGVCFDKKKKNNRESYFFSNIPSMWGYATWRRTVIDYDDKMKDWLKIKKNLFSDFTNDKFFIKYWKKIFFDAYKKKFLSYDYQMFYSNLKNKKLCIVPKINLVKNIGFGKEATHTKTKEWFSELETQELIKIKHPKLITPDQSYDIWQNNNVFKIKHNYFKKKMKNYKIFKYKLIFKISKILYKIIEYIYRLKK
jgi:hypothetical protein